MTLDQIKQRLETLPAMDGDCGWRVAVTYQRANGVLPRSGDARPCNGEIVTDSAGGALTDRRGYHGERARSPGGSGNDPRPRLHRGHRATGCSSLAMLRRGLALGHPGAGPAGWRNMKQLRDIVVKKGTKDRLQVTLRTGSETMTVWMDGRQAEQLVVAILATRFDIEGRLIIDAPKRKT